MSMLNKLTDVVNNLNTVTKLYHEQKSINAELQAQLKDTQNNALLEEEVASLKQTVASHEQIIALLQEEVAKQAQFIASLQEQSATLQEQSATLEQKVVTLQEQISTNDQTIAEMQSILNLAASLPEDILHSTKAEEVVIIKEAPLVIVKEEVKEDI